MSREIFKRFKMIWYIEFEILGKKRKTKKNEFNSFNAANIFAKKFSENYIFGNKEKVIARINSEDGIKNYKFVFHPDGEFEYYLRDLSGKKKIEQDNKLYRTTKKPRDFQKKKVYDWEEKVFTKYGFFQSKMKDEEVHDFINKILSTENAPSIDVFIKNGDGACFFKYYFENERSPSLTFKRNWGLNKFVICHELAHYLIHLDKKIKEGAHSENFVGVYIYLLSKYILIKEEQLWNSAKKNNLKLIKYSKDHYKKLLN
jgi:hypothetical protein